MKAFNSYDFSLVMMLFGTALGAGVLFLPIKLGILGVSVFLALLLLALPLCYFSHFALARFCKDCEICDACELYFGKKAGFGLIALYFLAFFPATLLYGLGLVNTICHFFELSGASRVIISVFAPAVLIAVMLLKEELIIKVCGALTYPLIFLLFAFSLYLVPHWDFGFFSDFSWQAFSLRELVLGVILSLGILVFSFEFTPVISLLSHLLKERYCASENKLKKILFLNSLLLVFFIFFFSISCVLASPDLELAKSQNISITSYLAVALDNKIIAYFGPAIAFLAIVTSFFGHYFAASESLVKLSRAKSKKSLFAIHAFFYAMLVLCGVLNPSILALIDLLAGPVITAILFILPLVGFYFSRALKGQRRLASDVFVGIFGLLAIFSVFFGIF